MKKLTRKITLSLVAILFAVIALGTTTYAWFTLGTTASVGTVEGEVTSGEGIEISLDGKTWVNKLTEEMLSKYVQQHAVSLSLTDVTKSGKTFMKNNGVTGGKEATANTDYLVLPIQVRAIGKAAASEDGTKAGYKLYVSSVNIKDDKTTETAINWKADVDVKVGEKQVLTAGNDFKLYASDAARVTFEYNDATKATIYTTHGDTTYKDEDTKTQEDGLAKAYATAKGYDTLPTFVDDELLTPEKNSLILASDVNENDGKVLIVDALPKATETITVNVYVWLNGYDAHCINAILGHKIYVDFSFVAKAE